MPPSLGISFGLLFCLGFLGSPKGYSIPEGVHIQSECRDRYLWVHVGWSDNAPRFEAVDATGVHPIDEKGDAPQCGYTVSTFRMDVYTTLRASYFSCYTDNQNDELFTFQLYITVTDAKGQPSRYPLTQTCPLPLPWSQREVICEEDYMEVTVGRDVLCTTSEGTSKEAWETAHSIAQKMANSDWQVMFLNNEERMSVTEAQQFGYKLSATPKRVVFRSPYGQSQSEIVMVDGVEVEVIHGTVFFRQNMMVVMVDISLACTKNPGSFDGARLLWDIPRMITPLVNNSFGFESRQINVGVENQLLDESTVRARGYTLKVEGPMVQMGVPFGAEGGYTKSLVIDNVYQETYAAFLFYEHVFSHVYADGGTVETRHRLSRVVDTPLLCRTPFTIDVDTLSPHQKTGAEDSFNVYLGNIPHDVALMGVKLNENQFSVLDATEHGYAISKVDHPNGTHGYTLRVPFDDKSVRRMYLGEGLHQYSVDINYTLSIMPQEEPYFHLASVVKQLSDEFPPELKGVCTQGGIVFTMNQPRLGYLWEIGVGHDPLTPELVTERGYYLKNDSHSLTLEVPWSTVGYTYEDINLRHFYGTFEVLSRDSQTSEIQTSTATRCLFRTDQLIICSTDGTMIVVTNTRPWPVVDPRSTTLSDRTCQPKEADDSRVLFEFGLNTCGTTLTVEDSYVLYENEILSNRESKFRLSVRCIYPLSSVSRLSAENIFKSEVPGVGFITFTGSTEDDGTDGTTKTPVPGCREQVSNNTKSDWDIESQHSLSYYESSTEGPHSPNNGASTAPNTLDPAPSYYNSLKGNTNLDGRAKTSVHTPTPGQYSGTLQEVAIGLHTASQPYNVQPATRPYGATQHIELKPGLSDQKHSQSEVKPATSKYLTLQHHITQKTTGQDDSRSNVKPAPSQAQPMLYEGSQSNRVDQTPIWSSVFQQNIIQQGSNQEGGKRINQQATGQYGGSQNYRVNPAASQPVRIQPATSYYGGIQSGKGDPSHSASQVNNDQSTTQYGSSQTITPAPRKHLSSQFFSNKHSENSATGKHFTTQHHNIQKISGLEASRSSSGNHVPNNWQTGPSQYDPHSGKREPIPSQSAAWYKIKLPTVDYQSSDRTASLQESQPVSSQYGSSQSGEVNQTLTMNLFQQNLQPATNENNCPSSIGVKPSTNWPTPQVNNNHFEKFRLKPEPNQHQGSQSGRNILDSEYANARHHINSVTSDPNEKCSQGNSGGNSNFIKVSSSGIGHPIVSKDLGAPNNPSRVSPIYSLLNQASAQSSTAQSVDERVLSKGFVQNPPRHFQSKFQVGDSNGQPDPIHGTSSNLHQSEPHSGNRQALNRVRTSHYHDRSTPLPSSYQSPSKVIPTSRHYNKYQDRNGNSVYENAKGSYTNPDPSQHVSPLSFYRTLQSSSDKPLSRTSVQSLSYGVQQDKKPNVHDSLHPSGQYRANGLDSGRTVSDRLSYLSNLNERAQGGGISTENGKDPNKIKVISDDHINANRLNSSENCPDYSGQGSVYPLHPSSSGPGYYSGSVHEGILRGRHGQ